MIDHDIPNASGHTIWTQRSVAPLQSTELFEAQSKQRSDFLGKAVSVWSLSFRVSSFLILLSLLANVAQALTPDLSVELLGNHVRLEWASNIPGFRLEWAETLATPLVWQPLDQPVLTENGHNMVTVPPAGLERFFRLGPLPLTTIAESSPANGETGVGVMRETILRFTTPLAINTLFAPDNFFAGYNGRRLLSRIELAGDRRTVTLFYLEPLPAGVQVTAVFDATGLSDDSGRGLDPDGDGQPGGIATLTFQTFGSVPLMGTGVIGHVYASELMAGIGSTNTLNRPLAGVTITVDGQEQTLRTVTDVNGYFSLNPSPAGRFFVKIDGRTASGSQYPSGAYYPFVGKPWEAIAGKMNNLAGGSGEIFLPKIATGTLKQVSALTNTVITFASAVLASNPALAGASVTIPANSLYNNDGTRGGRVGIAPVSPNRLPAPLPPGINPPLVITIQTDGANNFDRPVPIRFPNLPHPGTGIVLAPGEATALWSFNHKTGRWEIQGPMTVTADGKFIDSDPGVGVRQPGWHFVDAGNDGGGGGAGDGGGGDGPGPNPPPDPKDPCKQQRKSAESNVIQCGIGIGFGILTTVAKATPGLGCAISAAQGVIGSVADCSLDPSFMGCGLTILNNVANTAIGCLPVLGAGLGTASTLGGIYKSCLIDANKAALELALCNLQHPGPSGGPSHRGHPLPAGPGIANNFFAEQLALLQAAADLETVVFGNVKWTEVELTETPVLVNFLTAMQAARQPGTPGDMRLTADEQAVLLQLPLPSNLTKADAATLLDRFDRAAAGSLTNTELDPAAALLAAERLLDTAQTLENRGWQTTYDSFFRGSTSIFAEEDKAQKKAGIPLVAKPLDYRLLNISAGGTSQYGRLNLLGTFDNLILLPNTYYQLDYFDRDSLTVGHTVFRSGGSGGTTLIPRAALLPPNPQDSDHDGLPDEIELVVGTNPNLADTDGDGVTDGAEVAEQTDPLDGVAAVPGIIGSVATAGPALQVAVRGNYALVAEGGAGLGIYTVSDGHPALITRLSLGGDVNAVAFSGASGVATIGRSGVAVIDLTNPLQLKVARFVGVNSPANDFIRVVTAGDLGYVLANDAMYLLDLTIGAVLDQRSFSFSTEQGYLQDVAVAGDSVYLLSSRIRAYNGDNAGQHHVRRLRVDRTLGPDLAVLTLPGADFPADISTHLATGPGYVYVSGLNHSPVQGVSGVTIIADGPAGFQLVGPPSPTRALNLTANGSGVVFVGGVTNLQVLDVRDPLKTGVQLAAFALPAKPLQIALNYGRAYVADGPGGLQIVNALPVDTLGQPPTIKLVANFPLTPAVVEPERSVVVSALVTDDVQVRNVEFYLDGVLAANLGVYPFDFRFTTPATTNQATFRLRARAFDTGGNVAVTDEVTVLVSASVTPPMVTGTSPFANAVLPPALTFVQATFSKPLAPASVTATSLQLVAAGTDGTLDTGDDQTVAGSVSYDSSTQTVRFAPTEALPVGEYRATATTELSDVDGNHLAIPFIWNFSLKSAVSWNTNSAGLWSDANNWTNKTLPKPSDFVLIDRTNGAYTVSFNGGSVSLDSVFSREPLTINGGKFAIARRSRIENKLTLNAATLSVGTELDIANGFNWAGALDGGGTTVVDGELDITSNGGARLVQQTLVNRGHATWHEPLNSGILVDDPSVIVLNAKGAVWEAFDRQIMLYFNNSSPPYPRFDNEGMFRAFGNDNGIIFDKVEFNNRGTVAIETGSFKLNGGGLSTGAFEIAAPATLQFGRNHQLTVASSIHGDGGVTFNGGSVALNGLYDIKGVTRISSAVAFNGPVKNLGSLLYLTGQIGNGGILRFFTPTLQLTTPIVNDGGFLEFNHVAGLVAPTALILTNGAYLNGSGDIEVNGPLTVVGSALGGPGRLTARGESILAGVDLFVFSNAAGNPISRPFDNSGSAIIAGNVTLGIDGVFRNLAGATVDIQGDFSFNGGNGSQSQFVNLGTLRKSAGSGQSFINAPVLNRGLIEASSGRISFFSLGNTFTQTAGETRLDGGGITGAPAFNLLSGTLTGAGQVAFYQVKNLGGIVSPGLDAGGTGVFSFTQNYLQSAGATLAVDLTGTGFDQVNVGAQATLGGTLALAKTSDYTPVVGDSFRVLTCQQRVGTFATVTGTNLGKGLKLAVAYDATGVTVTVVVGP